MELSGYKYKFSNSTAQALHEYTKKIINFFMLRSQIYLYLIL